MLKFYKNLYHDSIFINLRSHTGQELVHLRSFLQKLGLNLVEVHVERQFDETAFEVWPQLCLIFGVISFKKLKNYVTNYNEMSL